MRAATVLVLGDPGAIRDELLLRGEIDVVWSASFTDAMELLQVYRVDACIIAPEFERFRGYESFREALRDIPCLVRSANPNRNARTALWSGTDVEPVLAFLARHTGLVFARYPRASVDFPVTAEVHSEQYHLRSINLSVSGIAVESFPVGIEPGTRVELCVDLPAKPIYLLSRVVRVLVGANGRRQAGLTFTDLQEGPRAILARAVEEALPDGEEDTRLFGALEIPMPRPRRITDAEPSLDIETPSVRRWRYPDSEPPDGPLLRTLSETQGLSGSLPNWFEHLVDELSDVEKRAAVGGEAPEWAHRVLKLRIDLARARAGETGEVPPALLDEAYQTFAGLEQETADAPLQLKEQVSSIRASLLRDVLAERP